MRSSIQYTTRRTLITNQSKREGWTLDAGMSGYSCLTLWCGDFAQSLGCSAIELGALYDLLKEHLCKDLEEVTPTMSSIVSSMKKGLTTPYLNNLLKGLRTVIKLTEVGIQTDLNTADIKSFLLLFDSNKEVK